MPEKTEEYVKRYQLKYKTFQPVYCPCLKEQIIFTAEGFNHLLFKRGHRRPNKQIHYRLPLINLIAPTLKKCQSSSKTIVRDEVYKGKKITATYFELSHIVGIKNPAKIKVILKKRGKQGKFFFYSVMKQKTPLSEHLLS